MIDRRWMDGRRAGKVSETAEKCNCKNFERGKAEARLGESGSLVRLLSFPNSCTRLSHGPKYTHASHDHEDGTSHPTITTHTTRPDRKPSMPMVQYVQSPRSRIPHVPMCDDFHVHVPCMRLCGCASAYACMALAGGMPPSLLICVASRDTPPPAFGCMSIITRRRSTMC